MTPHTSPSSKPRTNSSTSSCRLPASPSYKAKSQPTSKGNAPSRAWSATTAESCKLSRQRPKRTSKRRKRSRSAHRRLLLPALYLRGTRQDGRGTRTRRMRASPLDVASLVRLAKPRIPAGRTGRGHLPQRTKLARQRAPADTVEARETSPTEVETRKTGAGRGSARNRQNEASAIARETRTAAEIQGGHALLHRGSATRSHQEVTAKSPRPHFVTPTASLPSPRQIPCSLPPVPKPACP
jgi:hypothetical protein